jgi:hypothetical protein
MRLSYCTSDCYRFRELKSYSGTNVVLVERGTSNAVIGGNVCSVDVFSLVVFFIVEVLQFMRDCCDAASFQKKT